MSCVRLNTNAPALLGHAEDECPAIFGIQVRIREHQEALIMAKFDILLEIVKDLARMELLDARVRPNPSLNNLLLLKHGQTGLNVTHLGEILLPVT